ncbi:hypothetical protein [Pseudonocardia acidicola]|uniref:5,10-methylene-tetrahydrofolate dehydrogenase/Methenyl tetrahydrofolate cyclohydrolase n=1 Tax=Pseudonocardia acidicola TaxID=2724939 RepID=A0ABX1SK40_9PSEU|nr:hypothetical protein [Pseudonocardia acidicola]NMI01892.1 hypothetical protein [Pseudonocardia acidicola]
MATTPAPDSRRAERRPGHPPDGTRTLLIGIIADPGLPTEIARRLAEHLPDALVERSGDRLRCRVVVVSKNLSRGDRPGERLIDVGKELRAREGWDFAVVLTDLPLQTPHGQLVADLSRQADVAVIAIPGLSMVRPAEHARDLVVRLLLEWVGELPGDGDRARRYPAAPPLQQVAPPYPDIDLRLTTPAGRLRLLAAMVWINRPWRLVSGLHSALAATLITAAFGVVSNSVWALSAALGAERLWVATGLSLTAVVAWLILNHHLWQHPESREPTEHRLIRLFNAATLLTLAIGCLVAYLVLFAALLLTTWFFVVPQVLATSIDHPAGFADQVRLAWLVASLATLAGAFGAGLESSDTVRSATYGARVRHRIRSAARNPEVAAGGRC